MTRPVSKVITLLKDMVAHLDEKAEEDEEVYEQMGCWRKASDNDAGQRLNEPCVVSRIQSHHPFEEFG